MTVLDPNTVLFNAIYVDDVDLPEPVFAYVRFLKDGELGFSVLDFPYLRPDFSNCQVIWVKPEDFLLSFRPFEFDRETMDKLVDDLIERTEQLIEALDVDELDPEEFELDTLDQGARKLS